MPFPFLHSLQWFSRLFSISGQRDPRKSRNPISPRTNRARLFLDFLEDRLVPAAPVGLVIIEPTPPEGLAAGGTMLIINGQNLTSDSTVAFINQTTSTSTPGTNVQFPISNVQLKVQQPPLDLGTYSIVVTNADGSGTANVSYTVVDQVAPTVTSVSPSFGGVAGQVITVNGTSLNSTQGNTTVAFVSQSNSSLSVPGNNVTVDPSGNFLTVERPTLDIGNYNIVVTTNAGTSPAGNQDVYNAVAPALVSVTHFTTNGVTLASLASNPVLSVTSTADFSTTGSLFVQTSNGVATLAYTGITANSFTGITVESGDPFGVGATDTTGTLNTTYPAVFQATNDRYNFTFANESNLRTTPGSNIYVSMYWSSAPLSGDPATFYYLDSPNANGTGGKYNLVSSLAVGATLPTYQISSLSGSSLVFDLPYMPTDSARFVIGIGAPPTVTVVADANNNIGVAIPTPNTSTEYYDYVEFTLDGNGADNNVPNAQRFLSTMNINTSQVDQFGIPLTLSGLNNVNGSGVQTSVGVTVSPNVARDAIFTDFTNFLNNTPGSTPYSELLITNPNDSTQPYRILNPGKETITTADPLGNVFDNPIQTLFEGNITNLSLVSSVNQQTYTSSRTTVQLNGSTYNVLQFSSGNLDPVYIFEPFFSNNAPTGSNQPSTASFYSGKPAAPSWLTVGETAGQMVFGNAGVFGDAGLQVNSQNQPLSATQQQILADLENQVVAALNRGIATTYFTTADWQTPANYYPTGEVSNVYAQFMHTQSINGTPIFIDGKAYAIAYDDQGDQNPTLVLQNQQAVSVTLGPWNTNAPAGTNGNFVFGLYEKILNRAADAPGYANWLSLLNSGVPRSAVVEGFLNSGEARTLFIRDLYKNLLGREADQPGLNSFLKAMESGQSEDMIRATFYSSEEYFLDNGGTNESFLEALYDDEFNRAIDRSGFNTYMQALKSGQSRQFVSLAVLVSVESDQNEVEQFYQYYLDRSADPAGLQGWTGQLQLGHHDNAVRTGIISSNEFFQ